MLVLVVLAAGSFAAVRAFDHGSPKASATHPHCPARTGAGAYATTLRPSSGTPGSTVAVSGPLPVMKENGTYGGQTATRVDAYWNLDFNKWWSVLGKSPSPLASVAGSPVRLLGNQDVANRCTYHVQVKIPPTVAPGRYPIEVLFEGPGKEAPRGGGTSFASFSPAEFQVTRR
jgi:hypothetical protein